MAVVFISPKQRQKMFFTMITVGLLLFLLVISLGVIFSQPEKTVEKVIFNKAKITVDMSIFKQESFKGLQVFPEMHKQFSYNAVARNRTVQNGFISAESEQIAREILENAGLRVSNLQEITVGRDNPFKPYN